MADDITVRSDTSQPASSWVPAIIVFVVGLAIVIGLASIAPEGEHGPEAESVAAGTEIVEEHDDGSPVEPARTVSSLPPEGGQVTTVPPRVGGPVSSGAHEGTAVFRLISGQCPGPESFEEQVEVTTGDGTVTIARPEKDESLTGAVTDDGTFYAQAPDGLTRYDGKVGSKGFSAVYRQVVENCLAQYEVTANFS